MSAALKPGLKERAERIASQGMIRPARALLIARTVHVATGHEDLRDRLADLAVELSTHGYDELVILKALRAMTTRLHGH